MINTDLSSVATAMNSSTDLAKEDDYRYMRQAIELARKAEGKTSPNPPVGAVLVKGNKIVGWGYHRRAGMPHAEIEAINRAKGKARNAALYVTLEPCDHFGRTPPCCDRIISSGIKKVKVAIRDPNPINNGNGIKKLKRCGIDVELGLCKEEAEELNAPYIKFIKTKMPFTTVKVAQSLDGKTATRRGESKWISGKKARDFVQRLRSSVDAVMVGINTVLKDDPILAVRNVRLRSPARIIVDSFLKIPTDSKLVKSMSRAPLVIATTERAPAPKTELLKNKGAMILFFKSKKGRVPLKELMRALAKKGLVHVLVEGGGELVGSLFDQKLIDRFVFIVSNKIIGGKASPSSVDGNGIDKLKDAKALKNLKMKTIGGDFLLSGEV